MEGCEEGGAGKEKERKLWTGFHLGSAISITRLPEQGPLRLPRIASQASSSSNAPPGQTGAPPRRGAPCRGGCLEKGQRRLKGTKNKLAHLVPPFPPALTDPLWMSQQACGAWAGPSSLAAPKRSPENSGTPFPSRKAAPRGL